MATPYEIRLELVKLARDMLTDAYHSEKNFIEFEYNTRVQEAMNQDKPYPAAPSFPKYPTEEEVIRKARVLNDFISNTK